jgi:osmoprotectant transport system permease protein
MPVSALADAVAAPVIPDFGGTSQCVLDNRLFCWGWFSDNWGRLFVPALVQHIELTAIAMGIGFAIAFVLAVIAHRARWLVAPVTLLTSLLYTIPSLALFEILVPITGLGWLTIEIALTSYTLLLLFTNTLAGLSSVPADVLDAAAGIGLTRSQALVRVELPLALPAIIAGLRVATVTIVSLVTVAAFIGPVGLGRIILDALGNSGFNTSFIAGGGLCIALALVADGVFAGIQRALTPWAAARRGG